MAKKIKREKFDGLNPDDKFKLRKAIRQVWSWSYSRKLCVARATDKAGFPKCEKCKKRVPKIYPDHIKPIGEFGPGFIERMFVPSGMLQALCKKCHQQKTNEENKNRRNKKVDKHIWK